MVLPDDNEHAITRARLAAIVTSSADAIVGETLDGIITDWNPAAERLYGYTADEMIGQHFHSLIPPDRAAEGAALSAHVRRGERVEDFETVRWTKDGRRIDVSLTVSPVWDDTGQIIAVSGTVRDITRRKRLEEDHRTSEARYRTLVEQLPAAVYLLADDEQETPLYFSPYIKAVTGETPEQAMTTHDHWLELLHPEDRERVAAVDARSSANAEPFLAEYRHRRMDGGYVWVRDECVPVYDGTGSIVAWQGVMLDITERVEAEQALAASELRFRTAFTSAPIGMSLVRPDGRILQANAALCAMLGYDADALIGMHFQDFTHPSDSEPNLTLIESALAGERDTYELEKRYVRKDGRLVWVQLRATLVRDNAGTPLYLISQIQDITDRRATEQALAASETRFRAAFENAPIGMALTSPTEIVLQVNQALCTMLGYDDREVLAKSLRGLTHPDDVQANRELVERMLAGEIDDFELEKRYFHKNGHVIWALLRVSLVRDDDGTPLYFISQTQDITRRKQAETELREALQAAQTANRARTEFLAMMSHELRTPMQAVLGYADLLLTGSKGALSPQQIDDIETIHRGAERLIALVGQMLDLSRLEAGQLDLVIERIDLRRIIAQVREDVAPQAAAKGLTLVIDVPSSLPIIAGDAQRLRQILLNLAANAVKFTERGSVRITASQTEEEVAVAVSDTGIGIAPSALPFIFEEFRQAESGMTRRFDGAGLGLAIARTLAHQHGGTITVQSELHAGSTFTLYLPARTQTGPGAAPRSRDRPDSGRHAISG